MPVFLENAFISRIGIFIGTRIVRFCRYHMVHSEPVTIPVVVDYASRTTTAASRLCSKQLPENTRSAKDP